MACIIRELSWQGSGTVCADVDLDLSAVRMRFSGLAETILCNVMWIYIAHPRGTSNALYDMHWYVANRNVFNCFLKLSADGLLSDTLAMSSRLMGLPQRKPVGQKNSVGSVIRPEVVGWRI